MERREEAVWVFYLSPSLNSVTLPRPPSFPVASLLPTTMAHGRLPPFFPFLSLSLLLSPTFLSL